MSSENRDDIIEDEKAYFFPEIWASIKAIWYKEAVIKMWNLTKKSPWKIEKK